MTRKSKYITLSYCFFVILLLLADQWFAAKYKHYAFLRRQYECYPLPCSFDLTGDNIPEKLVVEPRDQNNGTEDFLVLKDNDKVLLRLPYQHLDGTFRTHTGIYPRSEGLRLLIYDGIGGPKKLVRSAYRWNGEQVIAVTPDKLEQEVISAMAHDDDTGKPEWWLLYDLLRALFYVLLILVTVSAGIISFGKHRKRLLDSQLTKVV